MEHNVTQKQVLDLATNIGYYIIKNGGEINRAEDTARRIGMAYGMDAVHVFAIASSIVITVVKDGETITQTRRVKWSATNLSKIERLNELSRKICRETPSYEIVLKELKEIEAMRHYPTWVVLLAHGMVGGAYTAFFGGTLLEAGVGFCVGIIAKALMLLFGLVQTAPFLINVVGAAAMATSLHLFSLALPDIHTGVITSGVIMNLVPGVLLTNCIRDFIATDYTAGTIKMVEAFFIAASIVLGFAVSMLWR